MEQSGKAAAGPALASVLKATVVTIRPRQWMKNLIIFVPLVFTANETWDPGNPSRALTLLAITFAAFVIFSVLAGAVYVLNDLFDAERDRFHPRKRNRPIASGRLPVPAARLAVATLSVLGLVAAFVLEPLFGIVSTSYLAAMTAYTLVIKRVVLLDVVTISGGFVLRAIAGAVVLNVPVSPWLYICTGLGALFIALSKRRSELMLAGNSAAQQRETLGLYSLPLLDQLLTIVASSTVVAYSLYTFTAANLPENHAMMLTIPLVVYGIFRYLYLVNVRGLGEHPEELVLSDKPFAAALLIWLIASGLILLVFRA